MYTIHNDGFVKVHLNVSLPFSCLLIALVENENLSHMQDVRRKFSACTPVAVGVRWRGAKDGWSVNFCVSLSHTYTLFGWIRKRVSEHYALKVGKYKESIFFHAHICSKARCARVSGKLHSACAKMLSGEMCNFIYFIFCVAFVCFMSDI